MYSDAGCLDMIIKLCYVKHTHSKDFTYCSMFDINRMWNLFHRIGVGYTFTGTIIFSPQHVDVSTFLSWYSYSKKIQTHSSMKLHFDVCGYHCCALLHCKMTNYFGTWRKVFNERFRLVYVWICFKEASILDESSMVSIGNNWQWTIKK